METVLADALIKVAPAILMVVVALLLRRSRDYGLVLLVGCLYVVDYTILRIGDWAPVTHVFSSHWNWEGKIASILLALALLAIAPKTLYAQVGLSRLPAPSRWIPILLIAATYLGIRAWLLHTNGGHAFDLDSALYQATLPGLDEELWFRGILWGVLANSLDSERFETGAMPWATLAIITFWFGWVHAASADLSGITINWDAFVWPAISGLVLGLLQGLGRAVWIPVVVHNASNTLGWLGLFK